MTRTKPLLSAACLVVGMVLFGLAVACKIAWDAGVPMPTAEETVLASGILLDVQPNRKDSGLALLIKPLTGEVGASKRFFALYLTPEDVPATLVGQTVWMRFSRAGHARYVWSLSTDQNLLAAGNDQHMQQQQQLRAAKAGKRYLLGLMVASIILSLACFAGAVYWGEEKAQA